MIAHTFCATIVAVNESSVGLPRRGRLVFELLAIGVFGFDAGRYLCVDCNFDFGGYSSHFGGKLADVLSKLEI